MGNYRAKDANQFIQQQLCTYLRELENDFKSDILSFSGGIIFGVDDLIRNAIEDKKRRSKRDSLTVCLTTGGGYVEVVHRLVDTLRYHYKDTINFVVPNYAYSAGTVLVMSGDSIHMDYFSRLGPIDPQVETAKGQVVPGLGYLVQYERLIDKAKNGVITLPEMHLLIEGFDQAELYKYEQERELSIALLEEWLVKYKFKNWTITRTRKKPVTDRMRKLRASKIGKELNKTEKWHSHGYGISMDVLRKDLQLLIDDFGAIPKRQKIIKNYHSLLQDYMQKNRQTGIIHTTVTYLPFQQGE
jgi:hypothetical protein